LLMSVCFVARASKLLLTFAYKH